MPPNSQIDARDAVGEMLAASMPLTDAERAVSNHQASARVALYNSTSGYHVWSSGLHAVVCCTRLS